MTTEEILKKAEQHLEESYKSLVEGLNKYEFMQDDPERFINQTMAEMCGIVMFTQELGVDFYSVNNIYEDRFYHKLQEMRKLARNLKVWKK